ncbi:[NiFe]-hydrogenase assembly chaperone HybE [uncultured Roseovarius sp.]|uniref:[NiFe]-hydrogenase assembly chaperone HybE n=1 Tax=uncultured Roseovarius sp. TaxID=293344 RepID=UPI00260BD08D|nr:[NiFe]-hydrogenase assembly chaperone HybE [uncultured Roseovarius sp.]
MSSFEGSFLGATDKISPAAIMECKICWTPYDPAHGDDYRQIEPGTPFLALPRDWSCPTCSAPKEQFMVLEDPGATTAIEADAIDAMTARLVVDFREIWHAKMRDLPMINKMLSVEAVAFQMVEGRPIGVLISPWFMNLIVLPGKGEDWSDLTAGAKEIISFPSGDYEFLHNVREMTGGYKACSLFSPMNDFKTHASAVDVAQAIMIALFDKANLAETDRSEDIRAAREAELAQPDEAEVELVSEPTRRDLITGGLAEGA